MYPKVNLDRMEMPIRILLVGSDDRFRDRTATHLADENGSFRVKTVDSATEGYEEFSEGGVDCILAEYELEDSDGLDFLRTVREEDAAVPFILLTDRGSEAVASEAISEGVTDYMGKETSPEQLDLLARRVENYVSQYRATREAELTNRRLEELTESTTDCLWMFDRDWEELLFISGYEEVWERPTERIEDDPQDFLKGVHPDDRDYVERGMDRLSAGQPVELEYRIIKGDGSQGWVWAKGHPVTDDAGTVVRVVGFTRDITERKRRERHLEAISNNTFTFTGLMDPDGTVREANDTFLSFAGLERADVVGEYVWETALFRGNAHVRDRVREAVRTARSGGIFEDELTLTDRGDPVVLDLSVRPVRDDGGTVTTLVLEARDVTLQTERERELRASQRRFEAMFNDPNILVALLGQHGCVRDVNRTALEYVDADMAAIAGEKFWNTPWFAGNERAGERIREWMDRARSGEYVEFELDHTDAVGEPLIVEGIFRPVTDEDGRVTSFLISGRDVTDRKQRERELEVRTTAINEAPVGVLMTDPTEADNPIVYVNDAFTNLTGYSREEILGRNCRFLQGPETEDEPVERMRAAIDAEEPVTVELRNYRKDGTMFWNRVSIAPVYDADGRLINYIGFQADVTEPKQRQQQLQVIGRVLRHTLRNETNVIRSRAELIERRAEGETARDARRIVDKADRLMGLTEKERLITEVLAEKPQRRTVDLCAILRRTVATLRTRYPEGTIRLDCPDSLPVSATTHFARAIEEVLDNALSHSDTATPVAEVTVSREDGAVTVTVTDNGPPIPEMELNALLGSDQTDPLYHGSGLGLWLVNLITMQSGGSIYHEAHDPRGNEITMVLPD